MPIRSSPYFNNPAFAQAASNLAALFAPPSGADAAGWATAEAKRAEASRLAQLWNNPNDPNFDRLGIIADLYDPSQSFYAVDQSNLTSRSNNAADNTRAIQTNRLDNQRAALTDFYQPLAPGEVRPEVPAEFSGIVGLPGAVPATAGTPKPLTDDEFLATVLREMPREMQEAAAFGSTPVESIVTPGGPRIATRLDAIGEEPVINKGAEAKPTNAIAVLPGGKQVPAIQGANGRWQHAQTGEELPADIRIFDLPKPQGSSEEVGLTTAVTSDVQKTILSIDNTLSTAGTLRDLIAQNPSSQGAVGGVRRFSQNLFQTANELGQMGPGLAEVTDAVKNGALDTGTATEFFDPTLPDIQLLTNYLAWQYAKSMSGDRVSNEQLRQAKEAIGGESIFSNQADSLARLDRLMQQLEAQKSRYGRFAPGVGDAGTAAPTAPAAGAVRTYNPATGRIE